MCDVLCACLSMRTWEGVGWNHLHGFWGDLGQTSNSAATCRDIRAHADDLDLGLILGDLSYADSNASRWDSFQRLFDLQGLCGDSLVGAARQPWLAAQGWPRYEMNRLELNRPPPTWTWGYLFMGLSFCDFNSHKLRYFGIVTGRVWKYLGPHIFILFHTIPITIYSYIIPTSSYRHFRIDPSRRSSLTTSAAKTSCPTGSAGGPQKWRPRRGRRSPGPGRLGKIHQEFLIDMI